MEKEGKYQHRIFQNFAAEQLCEGVESLAIRGHVRDDRVSVLPERQDQP